MRLFVCLLAACSLAPSIVGAQFGCPGDCDGDQRVTVDELMVGASMALGQHELSDCFSLDASGDFLADVSEITLAVSAALKGCAPTAEDLALLGVYDATGIYLYSSGRHQQQGIGIVQVDPGGLVGLRLDFDQFTTPTFALRSTPPEMVRFDGYSLEQGDLLQRMSGSARMSVQSKEISLEGIVVSPLGPYFPSLSHAIEIELTRLDRDYASGLEGLWEFSFESMTELKAVIPIRPGANGVGTCGPADMTDSSGKIVRHLDEAPCYFSAGGRFLYRGALVTLRGELVDSYQFAFGEGAWAVGFGIGTSQRGEWSARRAEIVSLRRE